MRGNIYTQTQAVAEGKVPTPSVSAFAQAVAAEFERLHAQIDDLLAQLEIANTLLEEAEGVTPVPALEGDGE